jgi:hypothetical protein
MRRIVILLLIVALLVRPGARPAQASEGLNPVFSYTHLMPSPFTLPAGRLVFGTDVALGITDFFQVGTSLIRDVYKFYNVGAKASLVDTQEFALAATLGFQTYNLNDIDPRNPDFKVTSWMPGLVTAFELAPRLALITGGNLHFSQADLRTDGIETSGYAQGAHLGADLAWAYNPSSGKKRVSQNAFAVGATYDTTYQVYGVGLSHHWPGFQLGIHYYPNASQYRVMPIIAGGGALTL